MTSPAALVAPANIGPVQIIRGTRPWTAGRPVAISTALPNMKAMISSMATGMPRLCTRIAGVRDHPRKVRPAWRAIAPMTDAEARCDGGVCVVELIGSS